MNIKNKSVIITSADTEQGKNIALKFAENKARIALIGKDEQKLLALADEMNSLGAWTITISGDIKEEYDTDHIAAETIYQFGKIDFLININKSVSAETPLWQTDTDSFLSEANDSIKTAYLITKKILEDMTKFREGTVISINSGFFAYATDRLFEDNLKNIYPNINFISLSSDQAENITDYINKL